MEGDFVDETTRCPNFNSGRWEMDIVLTGNHFCTTDRFPRRLNPFNIEVRFDEGQETLLYRRGEDHPEIVYQAVRGDE